jgi:hypothetical protein
MNMLIIEMATAFKFLLHVSIFNRNLTLGSLHLMGLLALKQKFAMKKLLLAPDLLYYFMAKFLYVSVQCSAEFWLYTGHDLLGRHFKRVNITKANKCTLCNRVKSTDFIFSDVVQLKVILSTFIGSCA